MLSVDALCLVIPYFPAERFLSASHSGLTLAACLRWFILYLHICFLVTVHISPEIPFIREQCSCTTSLAVCLILHTNSYSQRTHMSKWVLCTDVTQSRRKRFPQAHGQALKPFAVKFLLPPLPRLQNPTPSVSRVFISTARKMLRRAGMSALCEACCLA